MTKKRRAIMEKYNSFLQDVQVKMDVKRELRAQKTAQKRSREQLEEAVASAPLTETPTTTDGTGTTQSLTIAAATPPVIVPSAVDAPTRSTDAERAPKRRK